MKNHHQLRNFCRKNYPSPAVSFRGKRENDNFPSLFLFLIDVLLSQSIFSWKLALQLCKTLPEVMK